MKIEETANCCLYPSTRGNAEVLSANLSSSKSRQSADHIVIVILMASLVHHFFHFTFMTAITHRGRHCEASYNMQHGIYIYKYMKEYTATRHQCKMDGFGDAHFFLLGPGDVSQQFCSFEHVIKSNAPPLQNFIHTSFTPKHLK